jgi:hypothetical protein
MVVMAILAVDCVLVRELVGFPVPSAFLDWCLAVILPMSNILAIMIYHLVHRKEHQSRPFRLGFAYFGGTAVLASSLLAWYAPDTAGYPIRATLYPVFVGMGSPDSLRPVFVILAGVFLLVPHHIVAMAGGLAFQRSSRVLRINEKS